MRAGHARPLQGSDGEMRDGRRAASPLAAVEACSGGKLPGRDESLPYELTVRGIWRRVAGRACPAPTGGDGETGYGGKFRRGEGTPPYAWIFKWGRRAASPLAAVAVCGGGKLPGRDESLPLRIDRKRDMAAGCGPGMPGPYGMAMVNGI